MTTSTTPAASTSPYERLNTTPVNYSLDTEHCLPTSTPLIDLVADPTHPDWSINDPMPSWLTSFRPHQMSAIFRTMDAFTRTNTVILDAPVGSGKTVIAEMVRRLLDLPSVYVCSTKTLQDQFYTDFPHARILKGRANYPTAEAPFPSINAGDCSSVSGDGCLWCPSRDHCPYEQAKYDALTSSTAVLNTAYYLTEANGPGRFGAKGRGRPFAVLDEADLLEGALMGHVEVVLGPRWQRTLGVGPPKRKTERAKSNDWLEWAVSTHARLAAYVDSLPVTSKVADIRRRMQALRMLGKIARLVEELPKGGWVYDGYGRRNPSIIFRPITVDGLGQEMLWRHSYKRLLMSGSVISPGEMAASLGVDHYETVEVSTGWDAARRPIYVTPVANVIHSNIDEAYPKVAAAVAAIMDAHPDDRILVHGVSYKLTGYIFERVSGNGRPVFTYRNAGEREQALRNYVSTEGSVIVAPSLDRGVDFVDDLARVQVIAKVPYPNLGDKQVSARTNMGRGGQAWFAANTVRGVVQMIGRGMRHEDDFCETYVLDAQFAKSILRRNRGLLPGWVKDALVHGRKGPWEMDRLGDSHE